MADQAFDIAYEDLPEEIPIFPLARALVLPRGLLPLNIFEPRYLAMVEYALQHKRLIGMVQPKIGSGYDKEAPNAVFRTGCAGRISSFSETEDGRILITLTGVCRFHITKEIAPQDGFRRAAVDWSGFIDDLQEDLETRIDRDQLMPLMREYMSKEDMVCDKWEEMKNISCERLISCLSMVFPFDVNEKQMLLEAKTTQDRADTLTTLMEMEVCTKSGSGNNH